MAYENAEVERCAQTVTRLMGFANRPAEARRLLDGIQEI
jgi:hypothetical protein